MYRAGYTRGPVPGWAARRAALSSAMGPLPWWEAAAPSWGLWRARLGTTDSLPVGLQLRAPSSLKSECIPFIVWF